MPVKTPGEVKDVELVGSWFAITLDNGIAGVFTDASGFNYEMEVVETTVATAKGDTRTQKRPGTAKYQDITLKRNLSPTFNNVWPSKWSASDLDVGSDDLMTEEVTLAVEELVRNK